MTLKTRKIGPDVFEIQINQRIFTPIVINLIARSFLILIFLGFFFFSFYGVFLISSIYFLVIFSQFRRKFLILIDLNENLLFLKKDGILRPNEKEICINEIEAVKILRKFEMQAAGKKRTFHVDFWFCELIFQQKDPPLINYFF